MSRRWSYSIAPYNYFYLSTYLGVISLPLRLREGRMDKASAWSDIRYHYKHITRTSRRQGRSAAPHEPPRDYLHPLPTSFNEALNEPPISQRSTSLNKALNETYLHLTERSSQRATTYLTKRSPQRVTTYPSANEALNKPLPTSPNEALDIQFRYARDEINGGRINHTRPQ